jgi:hypothetical protein
LRKTTRRIAKVYYGFVEKMGTQLKSDGPKLQWAPKLTLGVRRLEGRVAGDRAIFDSQRDLEQRIEAGSRLGVAEVALD